MQLIGMLDSPYVRRVAIALIIAKTPFIHRPISLFRHVDQFSKLNPLLKAPTLITDDGVGHGERLDGRERRTSCLVSRESFLF